MKRLRPATFAVCGVAALATGCSGGNVSSLATPVHQNNHVVGIARAHLTIGIPLRKAGASANRRAPAYVSTATQELAIRAGIPGDGISETAFTLYNISSPSNVGPNAVCTPGAEVLTCNITIDAPVVTGVDDEFQVETTDQTPLVGDTTPRGDLLSTGDTTVAVSVGAQNAIALLLTGVIGQLSTDKPAYHFWAAPGATTNVTVNITANDYGGGAIVGPPATFDNPIVFSDTLATSSPFTYPSANLNANPANYGLSAPAIAGPVGATIVYTAPTTGTAVTATATVFTQVPDYLPPLPDGLPSIPGPAVTFALDPMVVSAGAPTATPIATVPALVAAGPDVPVTVAETGATAFTVTSANAGGAYTLLTAPGGTVLTGPITANASGVATFAIHPLAATNAMVPTIIVTDLIGALSSGTTAILGAPVSTPAAPM